MRYCTSNFLLCSIKTHENIPHVFSLQYSTNIINKDMAPENLLCYVVKLSLCISADIQGSSSVTQTHKHDKLNDPSCSVKEAVSYIKTVCVHTVSPHKNKY